MDHESMTAWLGDAADEMSPDQTARFARVWDEIGQRYPDSDDQDLREAVLSAAVQYLLGDLTVDQAGQERSATLAAERRASAVAQQVAMMAVEDEVPEAQAARRAGIDRMWLRKLLGKR